MNYGVMFSIQAQHSANICELVGYNESHVPVYKKTLEVRKTCPKLQTPFKGFIYCTASDVHSCLMVGGGEAKLIHCCNYKTAIPVGGEIGNGKVIGEFICDRVEKIEPCFEYYSDGYDVDDDMLAEMCLTREELMNYGKGKTLYGIHITELVIYEKPKALKEFRTTCKLFKKRVCGPRTLCGEQKGICDGTKQITTAPQSWGYVAI